MNRIVFPLSAAPGMAEELARIYSAELGQIERRHFPDGETYLRLMTPVQAADVVLVCTLDRPDPKIMALLIAAEAARNQGARSVSLVAPYLAYMRQDKAFKSGEAVSSTSFARLLSTYFDLLVTVDPHLHRIAALEDVYTVPTQVVSAAPAIADWVRTHAPNALLIGPDEESEQWVQDVAQRAQTSSIVLEKRRWGDFDVSINGGSLPDMTGKQPVIIDDIASSARTLVETVELLKNARAPAPICVVVHPIFAGHSYDELLAAGAKQVVSANTVHHPSNAIDMSESIAAALEEFGLDSDELNDVEQFPRPVSR